MTTEPHLFMESLIDQALKEDLPSGDLTTDSLGHMNQRGLARLVAKEDLVVSGLDLLTACMKRLDPEAEVRHHFADGGFLLAGQTVSTVQGNLVQIVKAKDVTLNFLCRLSGIATLTRCYSKAVEETSTQIRSTRQTTPGQRLLEAKAIQDGKGHFPRSDLSSSILIQPHHVKMAGGLEQAIQLIRQSSGQSIEVQVSRFEDLEICLENQVDGIYLNQMDDEEIKKSLQVIPHSVTCVAIGAESLEQVKKWAQWGVPAIQVDLTKSAPWVKLDLSVD